MHDRSELPDRTVRSVDQGAVSTRPIALTSKIRRAVTSVPVGEAAPSPGEIDTGNWGRPGPVVTSGEGRIRAASAVRPASLTPISSTLITRNMLIQRYPDNQNNLPAGEAASLNGFFAENYDVDSIYFTAVDRAALETLFQAMKAQDGEDGVADAWDELYEATEAALLKPNNATWDGAVDAAVDAFEANTAAGYQPAAAANWPGDGACPAVFTTAVQTGAQQRATGRATAIQSAYRAYSDDGRLLPGTILKIKKKLAEEYPGGATLPTVNTRLATVYQRQCTVGRDAWLKHLNIAGKNMKGTGGDKLHYTVFNDAVTKPLVTGVRVDVRTVNQILQDLFGQVPTNDQIHATLVRGTTRYHRYFDGTYTPSNPNDRLLDEEYNKMMADMRSGVQKAVNAHGRLDIKLLDKMPVDA